MFLRKEGNFQIRVQDQNNFKNNWCPSHISEIIKLTDLPVW